MERKEVKISLSKEEVKELQLIFKTEEDHSKDPYYIYVAKVELLDKAKAHLGEGMLFLNMYNISYIYNILLSTTFRVEWYNRATIVYNLSQKILKAYIKITGEAHE